MADKGVSSLVIVPYVFPTTFSDWETPDPNRGWGEARLGSDKDAITSGLTISQSIFDTSFAGGFTLYKMTGWYSVGGVWESWTNIVPNVVPPSGHGLTFVRYEVLVGGVAT